MARKPADQSVSREEIIRAAGRVLHEQGYDATTMKDIAARVNLTAASLYHHFKNKDFLLLAVLEQGLQAAIDQIEPIIKSNLSASEKITKMIHTHIRGVTDNTAFGAAIVFEIKTLMNVSTGGRGNGDEQEYIERRNVFFKQRQLFETLFRQTLEEGMASGEFRQLDAGIVAKAMLGAHNWVGVWYRPEGRLSGTAIADIMVDTFLTSLKK
jgi:TetR/AcrR family transcriptional regulator, cholesterol catabolism regulator